MARKVDCEHLERVITMQGTTLYMDFPSCGLIHQKCIGKECPFHPHNSKEKKNDAKRKR